MIVEGQERGDGVFVLETVGHEELVREFLVAVDRDFPDPLSSKVDLGDYAAKIARAASGAVCLEGGRIVSAVFGYTRDTPRGLAYVTAAATLPSHRGRGLFTELVGRFCSLAESLGLRGVHLYAEPGNAAACRGYEACGFARERFASEGRPASAHYLRLLNKTVLVTAIGSFSATESIRRLARAGYRVVGCDIYPAELVVNSRDVSAFYQVPLATTGEGYLEAVADIVRRERVSYVLPSTDFEVDAFGGCRELGGALVCCPDSGSVAVCRDKLRTFEVVSRAFPELCVPTWRGDAVPGDLSYPAILKPRNGRSSSGLRRLRGAGDLAAARAGEDASGLVVQPAVSGSVVTVDVVRCRESGSCVAVPREELLRTPNGAGTSVRVFRDEALSEAARRVAALLDVNGCVNLEFISSDEGYRLLECNPRLSGGVAFTCQVAYDCVLNHLRCFQGLEIEPLGDYPETYLARRYEETVMRVVEDA